MVAAEIIELHQPVGDPQLKSLWLETQSFRSAEIVGDDHRHVADQAAMVTLKQQWQPWESGIRPQGPETRFWTFRQLARILRITGPIKPQLHHWAPIKQLGQGQIHADGQRAEVQLADGRGVDQNRIHALV